MAVINDPRVIADLLRSIAKSAHAQAMGHHIIFTVAADMLEPPTPPALVTPDSNDHLCECSSCAERLKFRKEVLAALSKLAGKIQLTELSATGYSVTVPALFEFVQDIVAAASK